jgi:hypothetical protein
MPTDRTGERLVGATIAAIALRAEDARTGRDGEWRNLDVRDAFIRGIRDIKVYTIAPGRIRTVSARGRDWSYVGGEALRAARTVVGAGGHVVRVDETTFVLDYTPDPS